MAWTALFLMTYGSWMGWWHVDVPFLTKRTTRWSGGMTLPSGEYLRDNPDYVPKGPAFPLLRELAEPESKRNQKN